MNRQRLAEIIRAFANLGFDPNVSVHTDETEGFPIFTTDPCCTAVEDDNDDGANWWKNQNEESDSFDIESLLEMQSAHDLALGSMIRQMCGEHGTAWLDPARPLESTLEYARSIVASQPSPKD